MASDEGFRLGHLRLYKAELLESIDSTEKLQRFSQFFGAFFKMVSSTARIIFFILNLISNFLSTCVLILVDCNFITIMDYTNV